MAQDKRRIVILGATGSIGTNTADVCRSLADDISVVGVAANANATKVAEMAAEFNCRYAAVSDASRETELRNNVPAGCKTLTGEAGMIEMVRDPEVDLVLCAVSGTGGVRPVLQAAKEGKDIALASKEVLVMAGRPVMEEVNNRGVNLLPVDSEHSGVFQCLQGRSKEELSRVFLTASGGPFRTYSAEALAEVTYEEALGHPTWNMGAKITIDSATLMNKGLEVIEARWLFDLSPDMIDVLIHPQSIIHAAVELTDRSLIAQMGVPDMRMPIQYALTYPSRPEGLCNQCSLADIASLTFEPPDLTRFPGLKMAFEALKSSDEALPAVYNAANEVAVEGFAKGQLSFPGIWQTVHTIMEEYPSSSELKSLDTIFEIDEWTRRAAEAQIRK